MVVLFLFCEFTNFKGLKLTYTIKGTPKLPAVHLEIMIRKSRARTIILLCETHVVC